MYQPLAGGGLNFVNFATMVKSLHLAWISKLLSESTDASWKEIPNYYFSEYGGLHFFLRCDYNVSSFNQCLPAFYRELLLWNNKEITIENNTVFWRDWF